MYIYELLFVRLFSLSRIVYVCSSMSYEEKEVVTTRVRSEAKKKRERGRGEKVEKKKREEKKV